MRILPIFIPHAGCLQDCVFCNQKSTSQRSEIPSRQMVLAEIESALAAGPLDEIAYYGGSFTALPLSVQKTFLELLSPFLDKDRVGGVRISTRPDALDDAAAAFLASSGVTTVEIGCQSFADEVLQASGRGHSAADCRAAAALLRARGFKLGVQLMPGLPGGDRAEALRSLDVAISLRPDFLRIYPAVVLKDTGLAESWTRGDYRPFAFEQAVDLCADMELVCRARSVKVIRYGLQSNSELDSGAVLAGPYHPAFGQMVRSRLWRRALARLRSDDIEAVTVHPSDLSDALGHRRSNVEHIRATLGAISVAPAPDIERGCIGIDERQQSVYALCKAA